MSIYRCDFQIRSDVVLSDISRAVQLAAPEGFEVRLSNGPENLSAGAHYLVGTVVGPSKEMESAVDEFRSVLASRLDLLSIVSNGRFLIKAPIRVIDWETGQKDRRIRVYNSWGPLDRPDPIALEILAGAVQILDSTPIDPPIERALHHYRLGLLPDHEEDQFRHFWLALEIVADHIKPKAAEPIECASCKVHMKCAACGDELSRTPMATDQIKSMMREVLRGDVEIAIKTALGARHALTHGRSVASVEKKYGVPFHHVLRALGDTTWRWILFTLGHRNNPNLFIVVDRDYSNTDLVISPILGFRHDGPGLHPSDDQLPTVAISLEVPPPIASDIGA